MPTSEAPSGSVQELAIELTLGVVTPKNHPPSRVLGSLKDSVVEAVEKIATEDTLQRNPALAEPYSNPTTLSRRVTARLSSLHKRKIWTPGPARGDDHSQWGINWYMPTYMVLLGVGGACGALGHHFHNQALHGRVVTNADWTQRFALALAFFNKVCLVAAVEIAYKQTVWLFVKKRSFKVETLDSLFSVCADPLGFLNREFLFKATIPALLAALTWTLPLCAIASPASLTSIASVSNTSTTCNNIPTLNFGREDGFGDFVYDDSTQPMCFWDTKSNGANGITDYYAVASTFLTRLSTLTLLGSKGPMQPLNPCPLPGNCSYSIDFAGPAYRCQEHEDFESSATTNMTKSQFIPAGNYSYYSVSSVSEDKDGRPIWWDNASEADLGYFRTEPELWIGYAINTTKPLPKPVNTPWGYIWNNDYLVKVLKCEMFNATYSYTLNWHNGVMFVEAATRKLLFPIPGFSPSINASYGYRATAGYHAAGFLFRSTLAGYITQTGDEFSNGYPMPNSGIAQTRLVDYFSNLAVPDFATAVENEFAAMILSLASSPLLQSETNISTPCTISTAVLVWDYNPLWLVLSYGLAVFFMLIAALIGAFAFKKNGYGADMSFSSIVATTRNKDLDGLAEGCCLGITPLPTSFVKERLRFGEVDGMVDGVGVKHTAFGFKGRVGSISVGEKYS